MKVKPQKFENVTIYTTGNVLFSCIVRIDAREAKLWLEPFAQFKQCVHVEYMPKRGRRLRYFNVPNCHVVVVPTSDAIDPDDLHRPGAKGLSLARYDINDSRGRSDFDKKLSRARVPILADYRGLYSE
ncbi:MAG: hypothetical protein ACLP00_19040 [Terracidiphilus sp.]